MADHLGLKLTSRDIAHITANIFSTQTATYRKGQIGDWRNHFQPEHVRAFKETAGQLLIDLRYEQDLNW